MLGFCAVFSLLAICLTQTCVRDLALKTSILKGEKREGNNWHLFVVGADKVEDKAAVHEREQVVQEEGQTAI